MRLWATAFILFCFCCCRERRLAEIKEAHARYSAKQLENDKTTRVLEAGFGKEFSDRYMRTVVFDEEGAQYTKA